MQDAKQVRVWRSLAVLNVRSGDIAEADRIIKAARLANPLSGELDKDESDIAAILSGRRPSMAAYRAAWAAARGK